MGRVRSLDRFEVNEGRHPSPVVRKRVGRILCSSGRGYCIVNLYKNGKNKGFLVHRLVAKAFIPNPELKPEVNHLDEDKSNNCSWNLEWTTSSENQLHSSYKQRGANCSTAKLTEEDVLKIDLLLKEGQLNQHQIAELFRVTNHSVCSIKHGKSWAWLTGRRREQ